MKKINFFIEIIIIVSSLCITILLFFSKQENASLLFLLPLLFCILKVIYIKYIYLFKNITSFMIVSLSYLKNVLIPFLLYLSDYKLLNYGYEIYFKRSGIRKIESYNNAILLLAYEMIVIFTLLCYLNSKYNKYTKNNKYQKISKKTKFFFYVSLIYMFVVLFIYPELIKNFQLLFQIGEPEHVFKLRSLRYGGEGIPAIFHTILNSIFAILQILFPIYFIVYLNKKKSILLNYLLLFLLLLIFNSAKGNTFIAIIILLYTLFNMYPKHRKIIKGTGILILGIGIIFLFIKNKNGVLEESYFSNLSVLLSTYFSGILNVAYSLKMEKGEYYIILVDILKSIPFISGEFFKNTLASTSIFNYTINQNNLYQDQILPMIGQGYFYFGKVLAPILPCIILIIGFSYEIKLKKEKNLLYKNIYFYFVIILGYCTLILNINILIQMLFNGIILLVIYKRMRIVNE